MEQPLALPIHQATTTRGRVLLSALLGFDERSMGFFQMHVRQMEIRYPPPDTAADIGSADMR